MYAQSPVAMVMWKGMMMGGCNYCPSVVRSVVRMWSHLAKTRAINVHTILTASVATILLTEVEVIRGGLRFREGALHVRT